MSRMFLASGGSPTFGVCASAGKAANAVKPNAALQTEA